MLLAVQSVHVSKVSTSPVISLFRHGNGASSPNRPLAQSLLEGVL